MFLAQLHCHPDRLPLDDTFILQIYMDIPDGLPDPVVVRVPSNAQENLRLLGTPDPNVAPHDITWDYQEDPEESDEYSMDLAASKLWGKCYFDHALEPNERLLLILNEQPAGFNFGGDELTLAINGDSEIIWVSA